MSTHNKKTKIVAKAPSCLASTAFSGEQAAAHTKIAKKNEPLMLMTSKTLLSDGHQGSNRNTNAV